MTTKPRSVFEDLLRPRHLDGRRARSLDHPLEACGKRGGYIDAYPFSLRKEGPQTTRMIGVDVGDGHGVDGGRVDAQVLHVGEEDVAVFEPDRDAGILIIGFYVSLPCDNGYRPLHFCVVKYKDTIKPV